MYLKERRPQLKSYINNYFEKHSILWHLMERVQPSNMTTAQSVGIKKRRGALLQNATNLLLHLFERVQLLPTTQRPVSNHSEMRAI